MADRDQMEHKDSERNEENEWSLCNSSQVTSTNINDLPNEILLTIFCYLSVEDLALNVQSVCVRWSHLCLDDVLWKDSVFIVKKDEPLPYVLRVLENTPKLQCLELHTDTSEICRGVADRCKTLRKLKCFCDPLTQDIRDILSQCPNLEELTLADYDVCNEEVIENIVKLTSLRAITVLNPNWSLEVPFLPDNFFERRTLKLKRIADGCPVLQHLELSLAEWHYSDVKYFLERKNKTVISFGIRWQSVEGMNVFPLLKMYGRGLRKLILHRGLGGRIVGPSFSIIKTLSNLTTLCIRCADEVTADDMAQIFIGGAMSQLLELEIKSSGTWANEAFVNIICNNCPNLLSLVILNIFFKDDGLKYLYKCTNLEHLDLSRVYIRQRSNARDSVLTDAAMDHIARCPKLRRLNLNGSRLTEQCFGRLLELSELRDLQLTLCEGAELTSDLVALHLRKLRKFTVKCYDTIINKIFRCTFSDE